MTRLTALGMEAQKARHTPSPECSPSPRESLDGFSCQSRFSLKIAALVRPSTLFIVGILLQHLCPFVRSLPPDSGDAWITKASGIAHWLWHRKRDTSQIRAQFGDISGKKRSRWPDCPVWGSADMFKVSILIQNVLAFVVSRPRVKNERETPGWSLPGRHWKIANLRESHSAGA